MLQLLEYNEIKEDDILIDVRSPKEYSEGRIEGSINIPIFDDEERKIIGTMYKEDVEKAKKEGIKIGSRKLPDIFENVLELYKTHRRIVIYCARGGMRSGVISSMLGALGFKIYKLNGGYKAYRKYILENIPVLNEDLNYIILHGNTGVGKTRILGKLKKLGCDILDLEGCANHRGSLLGSIGLLKIVTQKQFETNLFETLKHIKSKVIFVEAESRKIGNVFIPECIHDKMKKGTHIFLDASIEFRIDIILEEYLAGENAKEEILKALDKLEKYISKVKIENYKELIKNDEYDIVVEELMQKYYDPMYMHSAKKYEYALNLEVKDINQVSNLLYQWYKNNF